MPLSARLFALLSRIRALFESRRLDAEFGREIDSHLAMLVEDYIRRGLPPDQARREAVLRFGGPMQIQESNRDHRSLPFVETTLQDIRYGLRSLRKHPAYSAIAIATLAVGIGAGTAVFSVVGAVLLRPLPYKNPGELVRIFETNPLRRWTRNIAAPANWADWKARNKSFTDIAAYEQFSTNGSGASDIFLTGFGEPQGLKALGVSGNFFQVLGATPMMGRPFTDDEQYRGPVARRDPELRVVAIGVRRRSGHRRQADHVERTRLRRRRRDAALLLLPRSRRSAVGAVRLRPRSDSAVAAAALARRRGEAQTVHHVRAGPCRHGGHRAAAGAAISRHEYQDGRASGAAPRQLCQRASNRAADAQRRGRPPVPDRVREYRQPAVGAGGHANPRALDSPCARRGAAATAAATADRIRAALAARRRARAGSRGSRAGPC